MEIKDYLLIPPTRVLSLIDLDFEELFRLEAEIRTEWIKGEKCECVNDERLDKGEIVLMCPHVQKEIEIKTKEIRKKISNKSDALICGRLLKTKKGDKNG